MVARAEAQEHDARAQAGDRGRRPPVGVGGGAEQTGHGDGEVEEPRDLERHRDVFPDRGRRPEEEGEYQREGIGREEREATAGEPGTFSGEGEAQVQHARGEEREARHGDGVEPRRMEDAPVDEEDKESPHTGEEQERPRRAGVRFHQEHDDAEGDEDDSHAPRQTVEDERVPQPEGPRPDRHLEPATVSLNGVGVGRWPSGSAARMGAPWSAVAPSTAIAVASGAANRAQTRQPWPASGRLDGPASRPSRSASAALTRTMTNESPYTPVTDASWISGSWRYCE